MIFGKPPNNPVFVDAEGNKHQLEDQLRPGQRIIAYASLMKGVQERTPPDSFEIWLWNLSEKEFKEVMKWKHE